MSNRLEIETALLEQVLKLPRTAELEVLEDYLDSNGHVNMMYYTLIGNMGWRAFFDELGLHREDLVAQRRSTFALRQVISYLNELDEGAKVAVHSGLVGFDTKRVHFMHYIINLSTYKLASIDERVIMYIDMNTRRSTTFEPEALARFEKVQLAHTALGWKPELSGAIKLKR